MRTPMSLRLATPIYGRIPAPSPARRSLEARTGDSFQGFSPNGSRRVRDVHIPPQTRSEDPLIECPWRPTGASHRTWGETSLLKGNDLTFATSLAYRMVANNSEHALEEIKTFIDMEIIALLSRWSGEGFPTRCKQTRILRQPPDSTTAQSVCHSTSI